MRSAQRGPGPSLMPATNLMNAKPPMMNVAPAVQPDIAEAATQLTKTLESNSRSAAGDLFELLQDADRGYAFHQPGWPALLKTAGLREIPAPVADRFRVAEVCSNWGAFPEIKRAWATVDNSLFLWRFDSQNDVPAEYSGEDQAIYAVGLAKARPGVFIEAIQYLLVLATPMEMVLLGVCVDAKTDELALQPLPMYTTPSDAVCMAAITSTPEGRIFCGGRDGNLYELTYSNSSGWRGGRRCQKIQVSGLLSRLVPSVLKLWPSDPTPLALTQIVVDPARRLLYTLSKGGVITLYDLGADAASPARRVAEYRHPAERAGSGTKRVVHMAVVSPGESRHLHLVVVCSNGARVYLTTAAAYHRGGMGSTPNPRPTTLAVAHTRAPPSQMTALNRLGAPSDFPGLMMPQRALQVEKAFYCDGLMLLADVHEQDPNCNLIMSDRDLTHMAHDQPQRGLREAVASQAVSGRVLAISEVGPPSSMSSNNGAMGHKTINPRGELSTQHISGQRKLVVVTSEGMVELHKVRPVDVLEQLLEGGSKEHLENFFKSYGKEEAAAMCLILATNHSPVAKLAAAAYEDAALVGEPWVEDELSCPGGAGADENSAPFGAHNYAYAVRVREVHFSGAHQGLVLHASRLLNSVWDFPVAVMPKDGSGSLSCRFQMSELEKLEKKLLAVEKFVSEWRRGESTNQVARWGNLAQAGGQMSASVPLNHMRSRLHKTRKVDYFYLQEARSFSSLAQLMQLAAQALLLLHTLCKHHFGRSTLKLDAGQRSRLCAMPFRDLVASAQGHQMARDLVDCLMSCCNEDQLTGTEELSALLRAGCAAFFGEDKRTFYEASKFLVLGKREMAPGRANESLALANAKQALPLFLQWAGYPRRTTSLTSDLDDLANVVKDMAELRFYEGVVELPLHYTASIDPLRYGDPANSGEMMHASFYEARQKCYATVSDVLTKLVFPPAAGPQLSAEQRQAGKRRLVELAMQSRDTLFLEHIYQVMLDLGLREEMLEHGGGALESFLCESGGLQQPVEVVFSTNQVQCLNLLVQLYQQRGQHHKAAQVLLRLAERRTPSTDPSLDLLERTHLLDQALLQARAAPLEARAAPLEANGDLVEHIRLKQTLVGFQRVMYERLQERAYNHTEGGPSAPPAASDSGTPATPPLRRATMDGGPQNPFQAPAEALRTSLKPLEELYNEYAQVYEMWDMCLELLQFSSFSGSNAEELVMSLWDKYLHPQAQEASFAEGPRPSSAAVLAEAARRVSVTGAALYPGRSLPLVHVAQRLELMSAGMWPQPAQTAAASSGETSSGVVAGALVQACHGAAERVLEAYNTLLSQHGPMANPSVQLQLLTSVQHVLTSWTDQVLTGSSGGASILSAHLDAESAMRQQQSLAEKCRVYKTLAASLPVANEDRNSLEALFDKLRMRLLPHTANLGSYSVHY